MKIPWIIFLFSFTGAAIGDCMTDQFSITAQGQAGTPIICGTNGGYHSKMNLSILKKIKAFSIVDFSNL